MKPAELSIGNYVVLRLRPAETGQMLSKENTDGFVRLNGIANQEKVLLSVDTQVIAVAGYDSAEQEKLQSFLAQNMPYIASIGGIGNAKANNGHQTITVDCHTFPNQFNLPSNEAIRIGINDALADALKQYAPSRKLDNLLEWLRKTFLVQHYSAQQPYLVISSGPVWTEQAPIGFRLHGDKFVLDIHKQDGAYVAKKITQKRTSASVDDSELYRLVQGNIDFYDATVQTAYKTEGRTFLDNIVRESDSYLTLWRQYNALERRQLLSSLRELGWIRYENIRRLGNAWQLVLSPKDRDSLRRFYAKFQEEPSSIFALGEELPSELKATAQSHEILDSELDADTYTKVDSISVQCIEIDLDKHTVTLQTEGPDYLKKIPDKGYLYPPLHGDRIRLKRRDNAWQRIRNAETSIPGLALFIEGKLHKHVAKHNLMRLSNLYQAFDGRQPTPRQEKAVEIALNTPDITLIQGPPGTGKTQVIAAICRLIEGKDDKSPLGKERILLTSYQHDAVETVAAKTSVFGLPSIKVGQRRKSDTDVTAVDLWVKEKIQKLENVPERSLETPVMNALKHVRMYLYGYLDNPSSFAETVSMLGAVDAEVVTHLESDLIEALRTLKRRIILQQEGMFSLEDGNRPRIIQAVHGLRVEPNSFQDDGPQKAYKLQCVLKETNYLSADECNVLDQAANWNDDSLSFLPQLEQVRDKLLDLLTSSNALNQAALLNQDVAELLTKIEKALAEQASRESTNPEWVVRQFIEDLENDPQGTRSAIDHYSRILAATCQQTVSQQMQNLMQDQEELSFDTVIVDEAARSNPLDLFIPMAYAKRRIILVGDHRQLPHLLEPDVEHNLQTSSEQTKDLLAKSLFERLFIHLRKQEEQDGIKRVITLDQQFRMHPALGQFVSDTFYRPHGEEFKSAPSTNRLQHEIDGYKGAAAVWIDQRTGAESSNGTSKSRQSEAIRIAEEAKRILDNHPNISLGIITFYAAQVDCIFQEMGRYNLVHREGIQYKIDPLYQMTEHGDERLRVGTVDAFQGKEFDVVILSLTRSNDVAIHVGDERSYRRKYGFLTLANRLCVAMSRQKRLLIVVGDATMVDDPNAVYAVPELVAFYKFCGENPYGRRI